MNLVLLHDIIQNSLVQGGHGCNAVLPPEQRTQPESQRGSRQGFEADTVSDPSPAQPHTFQLSNLAIREGGALSGQAKIDFELMLACAIFDEPKCQNCISRGKRQNPGNC